MLVKTSMFIPGYVLEENVFKIFNDFILFSRHEKPQGSLSNKSKKEMCRYMEKAQPGTSSPNL